MALHERLKLLGFFLSGLLVGVSLLVYDEILTLTIYCKGCQYPYPLIGGFDPYTASYFPFGGIILAFIIVTLTSTHARVYRRHQPSLDTGQREQPEISDGKRTSDT